MSPMVADYPERVYGILYFHYNICLFLYYNQIYFTFSLSTSVAEPSKI